MEDHMRQPHVDDVVVLTHDVPELSLARGVMGVIRSQWFAPAEAYEVEFAGPGLNHETRAVLLAEQLQLADQELADITAAASAPAA